MLQEKCRHTFELLVVEGPGSALAGSGIVERSPAIMGVAVDVRASIEQPFHPAQRAFSGRLMKHGAPVRRAHVSQLGVLLEYGDDLVFVAGLKRLLAFATCVRGTVRGAR